MTRIGLLGLFALSASMSGPVNALTQPQMPAPSVLSFAYSASHPVRPLSPDVIERTDVPDAPVFEFEPDKNFERPPEKSVDPTLGSRRTLSRRALCTIIASVARAHELPIPFFANVIWKESTFDPRVISHAGALGIAQFMPRTAAQYGLINPFEPIHALYVSARFLRELHARFGNLGLAAAAYNAGPTRVTNWMAGQGGLPNETRNYLLRVTGRQAEQWSDADALKNPEMSLMPAMAPCSEVKEAVRLQVKVVGVAKLIIELAAATKPAKPSEAVIAAKPTPEPAAAKSAEDKSAKIERAKDAKAAKPARDGKTVEIGGKASKDAKRDERKEIATTDGRGSKHDTKRDLREEKAAAKADKKQDDRKSKPSRDRVERKAKVASRRW